jgi:serine/threonine protein phosphatase PrpC
VINDNPGESIHKLTGKCIDEVLKESMRRKSSDNLTAIIVNLREDLGLKSADESKSLIRDLSCRSL